MKDKECMHCEHFWECEGKPDKNTLCNRYKPRKGLHEE